MKFDRILCDVPCTGDGTLRKNPDIWMKWNAANGNNMHGLQFRILRRGLEMVNIGGRILYSTCSLNPIENEAVIHRILLEMKGAVELVDVSHLVPGLKFLPGVSHWIPASKDNVGYNTFDEVPAKYHTQVRPQLFPPKSEEASQFHLEKCLRILPHLQDTGGFFVAVLEKRAALPFELKCKSDSHAALKKDLGQVCSADKIQSDNSTIFKGSLSNRGEANAELNGDTKDSNFEPVPKRKRLLGFREDPFVFFDDNEPVWTSIREFYDVSPDLPKNCLLTRCLMGKKKNIYFTSPAIKDLVESNHDRIKIINTGVKTFVRCDYKKVCDFRLSQEGLPSIAPFIGPRRRIRIAKSDLLLMLECDPKSPPQFETLDAATQENIKDVDVGCCLLEYRSEELNLDLTGWRGKCSLKVYIPSSDVVHYIRLLGGDVSKYAFDKFKKEPAEKDGAVIDTNLTSEGHMEVVEYKVPVEKERSGATDESNNGE
ncbi:unnamed protein product [Bemisia tabaci]|nr:unnamed protein product [Bemisia tabaci]